MREPNILHIAQDQKFTNAAYYLFEQAFPGDNKFVIVKPPANPPDRYINAKPSFQYEINSEDTVLKLALMSNNYSVTVLHSVNNLNASVFMQSNAKDRIMAIIYGAEIYNRPNIIGERVLGTETEKLYQISEKKTVIDALKNIYRKLVYRNSADIGNVDISKVLYGINTFGSFPSISYDRYISNGIYNPSVKKVPFSYYPIEYIIKNDNLRINGNDILFGNSASPTNNHVEGFNLLKECNLKKRTIIAPLSYGPPRYAKAIANHGKTLFGDNFKALTTFLPLHEYHELIGRCGILIMNHYRPEAMGNIIASLYMGAKVFLNDTDGYRYLKNLGCNIFLIEDDLVGESDALELLNNEQVNHNREVLKNELSTSVLVEKMRRSFAEFFDVNIPENLELKFHLK